MQFFIRMLVLACFALVVACAAPAGGDAYDNATDGSSGDADENGPAIGELGGMCGGIAGFQCKAENTYCRIEPGVCADTADYAGECAVRPEVCTMHYAPVCGCDGATYSNACMAAGAGASVAYEGKCRSDG